MRPLRPNWESDRGGRRYPTPRFDKHWRFVTRLEIALWIVALIALEIQHLKWIIWEHWECRTHRVKNHECGCKSRWLLLL